MRRQIEMNPPLSCAAEFVVLFIVIIVPIVLTSRIAGVLVLVLIIFIFSSASTGGSAVVEPGRAGCGGGLADGSGVVRAGRGGSPSCVLGVSWRSWLAVTAMRRPGREGFGEKGVGTGTARSRTSVTLPARSGPRPRLWSVTVA